MKSHTKHTSQWIFDLMPFLFHLYDPPPPIASGELQLSRGAIAVGLDVTLPSMECLAPSAKGVIQKTAVWFSQSAQGKPAEQ